jgi:hypothetical protein
VRIVMDHYASRGHRVIAFLPSYYTDFENVAKKRAMANAGFDVHPKEVSG